MLFFIRKYFLILIVFWVSFIIFYNLFFFSVLENNLLNFFLNPHNLQFVLGVLAAYIVKKNFFVNFAFIFGFFIILGTLVYSELGFLINFNNLFSRIFFGLGFMLIVIGFCTIDKKLIYPKWLVVLGAASYSIYLIHNPTISVMNRVVLIFSTKFSLAPEIFFILVFFVALFAGFIYYLIWEKPILRYLRNIPVFTKK